MFYFVFQSSFNMKINRQHAGAVIRLAGIMLPCSVQSPEGPEPELLEWQSYIHPELDCHLEVPSMDTIVEDGPNVWFRYQGHLSMAIHYGTREDVERNGLWVLYEPEGKVRFPNHEWDACATDQRDGLALWHTISFGSPYQSTCLSLNIKTDGDLDTLHQKMIYSYIFQHGPIYEYR
jgi:hypothetical protein